MMNVLSKRIFAMLTSPLPCLGLLVVVVFLCVVSFGASPKEPSVVPVPDSLRLHPLFGDHAVLQQGMPVPVWGTDAPGREITVTIGSQKATAIAGKDGRWMAKFPPLSAGGPLELTATDGISTLKAVDILVGEVWICSGQSNMEFGLSRSSTGKEAIASAHNDKIRLFTVPHRVSMKPLGSVEGRWVVCSPETAATFSAVGYYFARDIQKARGQAVGMIHSAWGGTPVEAWTSRKMLKSMPQTNASMETLDRNIAEFPAKLAEYNRTRDEKQKEFNATWDVWLKEMFAQDLGVKENWAAPEFKPADWKTMTLPRYWARTDIDGYAGMVWFRREVSIPAEWAGKKLILHLGGIDDADTTFFNGRQVGQIGQETPNHWDIPRAYPIDAGLVKPGRNVIAVRVFNYGGRGGFGAAPHEMRIELAETTRCIPIEGEWAYKPGKPMEKAEKDRMPRAPKPLTDPVNQYTPTALYNGMIEALAPYAIRGALWYQGESNAGRAYDYRSLFPAMIRDWRARWNEGDFPFLWVQLAAYMPTTTQPSDSEWAELREAQSLTLALPHTAQAMALDVGAADDIHPTDKQTVGKRLALAAMGAVYGEPIVYSGPTYKSMSVEGAQIRVSFNHVGGGLVAKGGELKQFAVAGKDHKFVWAKAKIDGNGVRVWADEVKEPVAVRYAWANNPDGANLYNAEGLPASPFRSDDWPMITQPKK
jgi:sialate O-acetylesterase